MEQSALIMFRQLVKFHGDYIQIKPFCQFFGLDFQNQTEKIKRDQILIQLYGNFRTTGADNKQYLMFCLTKRGFIRWIDKINPQNVGENLRPQFIQFQILIDEYLYGNEKEIKEASINYTRLKKLERLYGKIGNEIKRVKSELNTHWDSLYLQLSFQFDQKQLKN